MSLTAGCENKLIYYDFAGRNFLRLICWEMDILKRLPGECETPVCMPATWKMLKKRFFGKVVHCNSAKKNIF